MPRKNANTAAKAKPKSKTKRTGGRQLSKAEGLRSDRRPQTPVEDEAIVSRMTMVRHTGRGGRGR